MPVPDRREPVDRHLLRDTAYDLVQLVRILHERVQRGGPSNIATRGIALGYMRDDLVDLFLEVIGTGGES